MKPRHASPNGRSGWKSTPRRWHITLAIVRKLAGQRRLIASVKANAYGHGAVEFARRLEALGIDTLWTGSIAEAIAMREAGIKARILMFAGYLPAEIPQLLARGFVPTIYDREGALAVSRAARAPASIYIKVDSGLGRLGVPLPEAEGLFREIAALPNIQIEGVYSHLPFGDAAGRAWALARYQGFASASGATGVKGHPAGGDPGLGQLRPAGAIARHLQHDLRRASAVRPLDRERRGCAGNRAAAGDERHQDPPDPCRPSYGRRGFGHQRRLWRQECPRDGRRTDGPRRRHAQSDRWAEPDASPARGVLCRYSACRSSTRRWT